MACSVNQSIALAVHPSDGRFGVSCFIRRPDKASFITSRRQYSLSGSPPYPLVAVVANTPKDRRDLSLLKMTDNKDNLEMDDLATNLPAIAALSQEDRAGLVNALKSKLQDLAGGSANVLETLTPKVRKRVDALRLLQSQHDELEAKFLEERAALEARYQKLYQPLYSKRHDIVNGLVEVPDAAIGDEKDAAPEEKGVPHFWLNAMKMHEVLADEITDRDEGALEHLTDIKWYRIEEPKGFKLEFVFDTNPFFKNNVLTKTYHMIDEDEPLLEKAIGTEIEWYPGKCLTRKISKKKKSKKGGKPMTKTEECPSFFNFFSPPQVPEDDDDIDEEAAEELQNGMEQDYEIGSTIRDKIIPHAVSWFTGEAAEDDEFAIDEDDEEGDEDDDDEDEDEEDDDDEEDEEDDEEDEKPKARKKVGGKAQTGEQPPECKQQ